MRVNILIFVFNYSYYEFTDRRQNTVTLQRSLSGRIHSYKKIAMTLVYESKLTCDQMFFWFVFEGEKGKSGPFNSLKSLQVKKEQ